MLSHERVWAAIDALAKRNGLSPSGLARRAGLDPTTFNRSKRIAADGRPRWPSTESLSKVLDATATGLGDFVLLMSPDCPDIAGSVAPTEGPLLCMPGGRTTPAAGNGKKAGSKGDIGPDADGEGAFALEVNGNALLPFYRNGDTIIVAPNSPIRSGDRVVVRMRGGDTAPWILTRRSRQIVELRALGYTRANVTVSANDVEWISRITWASQ